MFINIAFMGFHLWPMIDVGDIYTLATTVVKATLSSLTNHLVFHQNVSNYISISDNNYWKLK